MARYTAEARARYAAQTRAYRLTPEYRAWREANRERINEYKRNRRRLAKPQKDQQRAQQKDERKAKRETEQLHSFLAQYQPLTVAQLVARQYYKHIEATLYSRQKSKLRKAIMRNCNHMGHISGKAMRLRYQQFDNACAYCGHKPANPLDLQIEHVLAISSGGPHALSNIVPACQSCNYSKGKHPWLKWYKQQPFYSHARRTRIETVLASTPYPAKQLTLYPDWVLAG